MRSTRRRLLGLAALAALALLTVGQAPARADLLIYDNNTINQNALAAATQLGIPFTRATAANFNTLLTSGTWDAVIVDCPSTLPTGGFGPLTTYITGGGRVAMSFWTLQTEAALAAAFQVGVASSFTTPQSVFRWDAASPIFTTPYAVGDLPASFFSDLWADDGDRLNLVALSGATAVAGFTAAPTAGEAAIVIGNSGRTIYNGFLWDELRRPESPNLIANQITFLLGTAGGAVPEPSTLALGGLGVLGLVGYAWRRRK
jgi:hypothetical protein